MVASSRRVASASATVASDPGESKLLPRSRGQLLSDIGLPFMAQYPPEYFSLAEHFSLGFASHSASRGGCLQLGSLFRDAWVKRRSRLFHDRNKLVGKPRHREADANAAYIRTTANPAHPAALSYIALNHGP